MVASSSSKGEHVLLRAGAGGVGLVANQYAQFVGAVVCATIGSKDMHVYLRAFGEEHITTTRNSAAFEVDLKRMSKEQGVDGTDMVLNSF